MGDVIDIQYARRMRESSGSAIPLARAARRRQLVRVLRGAYAVPEDWATATARMRHRTMMAIVRERTTTEPVFCGESAAVLHDLPLIGAPPEEVRVAVPRGRGHDAYGVRRIHRVFDPRDVVEFADGSRGTSLLRTAVDVAATGSMLTGIVVMAHLLDEGVTVGAIEDCLTRAGSMRGIRNARRALELAPRRSESPLETLVVVRCRDLGFAEPMQQRVVRGVDGVDYRVDFAWRDGRILAEADGKLKYRQADGTPTPTEVLWNEKRREDAIRPRCDVFVRIAWEDAWTGEGLSLRLTEAGVPRVRMPRPLTW